MDPAPFLAKGVSASDLVQLRESALVNTFGLDELQIIRVSCLCVMLRWSCLWPQSHVYLLGHADTSAFAAVHSRMLKQP